MNKSVIKLKRFLEKRQIEPKKQKDENILNIPNPITFSRIILTFIIIYMFVSHANLGWIIMLFVLGMLTDFFDGYFARKLNQVTEFGRQFDILADRFLLIVTVIGIVIMLRNGARMNNFHLIQIFMILTREIVTSFFAVLALIWGKRIPDVRYIGKITTVLQGITFPLIILSVYYSFFNFSIYFSILTMIVGFFSALYYISDLNLGSKK